MIEYYYKKLLQAICFTNKPEDYFDKKILSSRFLVILEQFLLYCHEYSIMNEQMKDNLLRLTDYLRYNGLNEISNEFIRIINTSAISYFNWQKILEEEFEARKFSNKEYLDFLSDESLNELFYSLELDYKVLKSLLCDEETFYEHYIDELMLDEFYFSSIKKINQEKPKLLNNQKSWIRICTINLQNEEAKNSIDISEKKDYKRLLKTGKVLIKKVIK